MENENNIEKLADAINEIRDWVKEFREGRLHWIELEEPLLSAKEAGLNLEEDSIGLGHQDVARILKACAFLHKNRPEVIKARPPVSHRAVAYLPHIYKLIPDGPEKAARFDEVVRGTLDGSTTEWNLSQLSRELQGLPPRPQAQPRAEGKATEASAPRDQFDPVAPTAKRDAQALAAALQVLDYSLDRAILSNGYDKLHGMLADECDQVAVKLNCISDLMFRDQWDKRKEIKL